MATRFEISLADLTDEAELRQRMGQDHMKGDIVLSFRREPNYFLGCAVQGEQSQIIKCTDLESGQIVGLGARHTTRVFVNGQVTRIGYLSDLRADPAVRGRTLLARGYSHLRNLHDADPLPFYFSVILGGNQEAVAALTSSRAGLPVYKSFGRIMTPAIHLDRKRPEKTITGVVVKRGAWPIMPQVFAFLERENAKRQFAPYYRHQDLGTGRLQGLQPEDFYIAWRDTDIIGCVAAWDQSGFRQTHVEQYSTPFRILRPFYNLAAQFSPLRPLPHPGGQIRFVYLALVCIVDSQRDVFATLLRNVYRDLRTGASQFLVAGLHEKDPLCPVLDDYRRIEAGGGLYIIHYPEQEDVIAALDDRPPYIEMASV